MFPRSLAALAALTFAVSATAYAAERSSAGPSRPIALPGPLSAAAPVLVGQPRKVCQAIGDVDWATGAPTADRTFTNGGLDAADLGFPVEHKGKLILLFGDSWPPPHGGGAKTGAGEIPPDDSVAVTRRAAAPSDAKSCLDLSVNHSGATPVFTPATITTKPVVRQGFFNVPTSGVSMGGELYAAFWTDHCMSPGTLDASVAAPLTLPATTPDCPQTQRRNSLGRALLASSSDDGRTFAYVADMPRGFNYPIFATQTGRSRDAGGTDMGPGVFVFASPRYRAGVPYLAFAPAKTFADPASWRYFAGLKPNGAPTWVTWEKWTDAASADSAWAPAPGAEVFRPLNPSTDRCVGEASVTWIDPMDQWLMLYNCRGEVFARVAYAPWGPWSAATLVLSPSMPGVPCKLTMNAGGCPGGPPGSHRDYWPARHPGGKFTHGGFYAPYVLNRYTTDADIPGSGHVAVIYWLVSPWNPYETTVMSANFLLIPDIPPPPPPHP